MSDNIIILKLFNKEKPISTFECATVLDFKKRIQEHHSLPSIMNVKLLYSGCELDECDDITKYHGEKVIMAIVPIECPIHPSK